MIKYTETQVTFSEVPDEISLCINISNCPHRCKNCHSPHLQEDIGEELTFEVLDKLINTSSFFKPNCFVILLIAFMTLESLENFKIILFYFHATICLLIKFLQH